MNEESELFDAEAIVLDSDTTSIPPHQDSTEELKYILEALLMAADKPLSIEYLADLLTTDQSLESLQEALVDSNTTSRRNRIKDALQGLMAEYQGRGIELIEVASGYRFQTHNRYNEWVSRLWEEKPQKYSRALLETLALIAYRQPITRGDIEQVRGVAVSTSIIKTLQERNWVRVIGHREVPGRPSIYGTTRQFLDYFKLTSLDQLPPLAEIRDLDAISNQLSTQLELETG